MFSYSQEHILIYTHRYSHSILIYTHGYSPAAGNRAVWIVVEMNEL